MRPSIAALLTTLLALTTVTASAQDTKFVPFPSFKQTMIAGPDCLDWREAWEGGWSPCGDDAHVRWLKDVTHWRDERRLRIGFDPARYADPALRWTQTAFMQAQVMVEDRYLYDPVARRYTVDRLLDDLATRYGGIDAVLIWPGYPNIGVDTRNQLDLVRSMPGGIDAVRRMVADFHRRGVRVLFPLMLWDQGTHDPGKPWPDAVAELMKAIGADGINGDTQDGVPLAFATAAERIGTRLALQPEGVMHDEQLAWNVMSWGQYEFRFTPKVDRFKWLETRHMVNISDRWARRKTDDLQYAFFNGIGWESWENVWGIWNGITSRDAEATRRVATIARGLGAVLNSPGWEPFHPMRGFGVFASRWPADDRTAWTIVNRNEYAVSGPQLVAPHAADRRWFDLYHGVELTPRVIGGQATLSFDIEAEGYGAIVAVDGPPDASLVDLMTRMKTMTARPLADYPADWKPLPQRLVPIAPTAPRDAAPDGMVTVPTATFAFEVRGVEIEGEDKVGVDVAYPWEDTPRRFHARDLPIHAFHIDRTPVTNAQFKAFLDVSGYRPADDQDFLKDWRRGAYPAGWANKPVTWVSIEDARAYATWAGKRLPREWEWQYAAQGSDGRAYPWGDAWRADAVPAPNEGREPRPLDDVGTHPAGASPFGVDDLVGTVWQWTDEYEDEHTRAAIVRGGSAYRPQGSIWYFPSAYRNDEHGKLLLMAPGRDRSGMVGFRCVADAP